jgi:hypothetical protein
MEVTSLYFDRPGPENTDAVLAASARRASELGITQVVVATSTGKTALVAARAFRDRRIVGVTLQRGLWEKYVGTDAATVEEAESLGVTFLTCPHTLMGAVDSAIGEKFGGVPPQHLISHVYYTWSQGTKVAVECMMMAADAGLLDMSQEVVSVAGTDHGADTALVLKPVFSHDFFSLRIRELIAKPR